jgi:hypothetical protein
MSLRIYTTKPQKTGETMTFVLLPVPLGVFVPLLVPESVPAVPDLPVPAPSAAVPQVLIS